MRDSCGRNIQYVRLSVTRECLMRCGYCQPSKVARDPLAEPAMTVDEIDCLIGHLARIHGVRKVRLTGGEPTEHSEILSIVRRLANIEEIQCLAMTTNGLTLADRAFDLADAGLDCLNVSLDTLNRGRFRRITGLDALDKVLEGLMRAIEAGLKPIKINAVLMRGVNDREPLELIRFAADHGVEIRFIELMQAGYTERKWEEGFVAGEEVFKSLGDDLVSREPLSLDSAPARRWRVSLRDGRETVVGLITPVSRHFCERCNRVRITSEGNLHPCLMGKAMGNFLPALRPEFDPEQIDRILAKVLAQKAEVGAPLGSETVSCVGG